MAARISSGSQLQEVVGLARRRLWQVLLPAVLTGAVGVMAGSLMPAKYSAKTVLELVAVPPTLVKAGLDRNALRERAQAADRTLMTNTRLDEVLLQLEWEHYQTLPPDERRAFVKRVAKNLDIHTDVPNNTTLMFLIFEYQDTDPQRAAQFANALREYFVEGLIEDVRKKAVVLFDRLADDLAHADESYEEADRVLQDLKREHSISPTQSLGPDAREREQDPIFEQLTLEEREQTKVSKDLQEALLQRGELVTRLEGLQLMVNESDTEVGGIGFSEKIGELREKIQTQRSLMEGKLDAHTDVKHGRLMIAEYERQIAQLEARSVDSTRVIKQVPNEARALVQAQISELDYDVRGYRSRLDSIKANIRRLQPELEKRTSVYAQLFLMNERFNRARMRVERLSTEKDNQGSVVDNLGLPDFSPFEITELALPPTKPSSPSALIVVAAGVILGLALGLLFALLAEFGRNAFRTPADLASALPAPVLGVVNQIVTLRERRANAFRAGLVGASTLILAGGILWITWAFQSRPGLLGPELTGWLDDVRGQLR